MRLVAVIGADGTGKTTQARLLADRLNASGFRAKRVRPVFLLFDPWRLLEGNGGDPSISPRLFRLRRERRHAAHRTVKGTVVLFAGYLYALATYAYMRAFLRREEFVVCDRYFYQFFYDVGGPAATALSRSFPRPSVAFWLDGDLSLVASRLNESLGPTEFRYYAAVLQYYRELAAALGFVKVDARTEPRVAADIIWKSLMDVIRRPTN